MYIRPWSVTVIISMPDNGGHTKSQDGTKISLQYVKRPQELVTRLVRGK